MEFKQIYDMSKKIKTNIQKVIVGKDDVIDLMLIAMICSGHVLLEDVPGTGKTLLAKAMASSIDSDFKRIQFTPDLLPSDLTGINYFNQKISDFQFRPGPIFTNILLADEINRATPRTQSSLLECMEERQVTIDGETRIIENPFMVIATQNPIEIQGTFPLPEAQLDRFLVKIDMGYPTTAEGVEILSRFKDDDPLDQLEPVVSREDIIQAQINYSKIFVSPDILEYIVKIAEASRKHTEVVLGISPRGTQALLKAASVYAILQGRDYVLPDDVKVMCSPVLSHRLILRRATHIGEDYIKSVLDDILKEVTVPSESELIKDGEKDGVTMT